LLKHRAVGRVFSPADFVAALVGDNERGAAQVVGVRDLDPTRLLTFRYFPA